jgi:hypothetical protein
MLPRLTLNWWAQVILLPQTSEKLGPQVHIPPCLASHVFLTALLG